MTFLKNLILLSIFTLFSCTVPQTRSVQRFNFEHLTQEMLDGTIWCGPLTKHPASKGGFMAIRYQDGKAGLVYGKSKNQVLWELKRLPLTARYEIDTHKNKVRVLNFWDGTRGGLGRVNADVITLNNSQAKIQMFASTSPTDPIIYEVDLALRETL